MILFLFGKDSYRSRQQLKKMMEKFKQDRDPQGLNIIRVDAEKDARQVLEQMLGMPFLAEKRMVVIENLLISKEKELQQEVLKRVEEKSLPDSNVIVFWEGIDTCKTKDAKALLERLGKEKFAQQFDLLTGVKLQAWIETEVKERGGEIDRDASKYLADHVGGDMWQLSRLLDQLIAYKDEEGIVQADVQLFLDQKVDDNIFNLVDSIVGKNPKQVFQMISEQYRQGKDAGYVFAMILRQFRILLEIRDLMEREDESRSDVLAKKLSLHPFVVKKSLPLANRYSMEHLKEIYRELLDLDIATKTGAGDQKMLLDVFVGRRVI
ncbi:MAG: DNA polymerase III subunit delta [Candidatus Magasanikbacteria bacterium]